MTGRRRVAQCRVDDVLAASTAVQHLIDLGHTRIAHIGGTPEHAGLEFSTPGDRLRSYRETMAGAGLPIDPAWEVTGDFTAHGGLSACRALLEAATLPTAVFAAFRRDGHRRDARVPRSRPAGARGHFP